MTDTDLSKELIAKGRARPSLKDECIAKVRAAGTRAIFEIGKALCEYKAKAPRGEWHSTLEELDMAQQRASEYMNAYTTLLVNHRISGDLSILSPSVIFLLGAPSTPAKVRDAVVNDAEKGTRITHKALKELIADYVETDKNEESANIRASASTPKKAAAPATAPIAPPPPPPQPIGEVEEDDEEDDVDDLRVPDPHPGSLMAQLLQGGNASPGIKPPFMKRREEQVKDDSDMKVVKDYLWAMGWWGNILRDAWEWDDAGRPSEDDNDN